MYLMGEMKYTFIEIMDRIERVIDGLKKQVGTALL